MNTHMFQSVIHTAEVVEKRVWNNIHRHLLLTAGLLLGAAALGIALVTVLPRGSTANTAPLAKAVPAYDATGAMENSVVYSWEARPALRPAAYDATAAMNDAVVYSWEARPAPRPQAYDATAAMRQSVVYSWEVGGGAEKP